MIKNKSLMLLACASFVSSSIQAGCNTNSCSTSAACTTSAPTSCSSSSGCASHQFVPRGITEDLVYIDAITFWERHRNRDDEHKVKSIFTNTFLYQESRKSKQLGSAFLLGNGCNAITVAQNPPADVNSLFLGLFNPTTPFSSTFSIQPQSKIFGYHFNWYVNLDDWLCGLWFDLTTAILNTRNSLNCCEIGNVATQCPGITSVSTALNNPAYQFGAYYCGGTCDNELRRTGIDDVQFRLGYEMSLCSDNNIMGLYLIGTAPAGRKVTAANIFEPLVGTQHGSIGVGFDGEFDFNICDHNFSLLADFNYRYVLRHNECRTFDLTENGPLSRFLLVAAQTAPAVPLPGINFFTQSVNVTPGSTIQLWLALNYELCDWDFEVGYDLFWRQKEKISTSCCTTFNPAIGIYNLGCIGAGCSTSSTSTIGTFAPYPSDATFSALDITALNLNSAAAGRALTNKFYGAVATAGCVCDCLDWETTLGASYEFVTGNDRCNALSYWAIFGKFGLIF